MQDPNKSFYAPSSATEKAKYWQQYSNAGSDVPLYGDGNWVDAWPRPTDAPPSNYSGKKTSADNGMRRYFVNRHNYSINAGFADGHTEKVTLRGLWDQNWYRGYTSPFYKKTHSDFRLKCRSFVEKEILPFVHEWDLAGEIPLEMYKKAGAIGIFGDGFEAEYGGHGQRDAVLRLIMMQELSRAGSGGFVAALLSNYIGLSPIGKFGSHELKSRVLPP